MESRHSHSNRYLYVTNQRNATFNSLKEFGIAQGQNPTSKKTIFSSFFYENILDENGKSIDRQELNRISGDWHSALSYEFRWKHPETNKIIIVRRLKRFRSIEMA